MRQQVLVIDDSKAIHALVKTLLADDPVDVQCAADPAYGIALSGSIQPDLILLDVEMPGMNGFEVCRKLKSDPQTTQVPIIFLTASSSVEEKVRGLELGAVDYVTKPFHSWELWARVRASLRIQQLVHMLEKKALLDPLTGMGNRAMFDRHLAAEIAMRIRFKTPLSCIVMDVDHFKMINDANGHPFGDQVLRKVAEIITTICRTGDVACRYGGDEFVIIAPHSNATDAALLAKRIGTAIGKTEFARQGIAIRITSSFGVADATDVYDRSIFQRADDALYHAKQNGGNRVSVAPQPQAQSVAA
ncbi:MAG: diguanylate cyclase [Planctomycetota bacterium]|nr:diguanylate cyclase [Planctomycetota bacterium]